MRAFGITSRYLPKNSTGSDGSLPNASRYLPPIRTSISQASRDMPIDFGTHHCLKSSGRVHASKTWCTGASNVRVTTISRSDVCSTVVRLFVGAGSFSLLASIGHLLAFQLFE